MKLSTIARMHDTINRNTPYFELADYLPFTPAAMELTKGMGMRLAYSQRKTPPHEMFGWCN